MNWFYLVLNLCSFAIPFAFSFEKRASFYKKYFALIPGLVITATIFLIWDFWFTEIGIWKFNPDFVLGVEWVNLPFEEWMFFVLIPYSCVFIHESMRYFFPVDPFQRFGKPIAILTIVFSIIMAVVFNDRYYTAVTFTLLAMFLTLNLVVFRSWFLGRFFMTYVISLIPFGIVNGLLTSMPVLIYNDLENCGLRIGTIPFEDFFYSMLMLLINITVYEHLLKSREVS